VTSPRRGRAPEGDKGRKSGRGGGLLFVREWCSWDQTWTDIGTNERGGGKDFRSVPLYRLGASRGVGVV